MAEGTCKPSAIFSRGEVWTEASVPRTKQQTRDLSHRSQMTIIEWDCGTTHNDYMGIRRDNQSQCIHCILCAYQALTRIVSIRALLGNELNPKPR